MNMEDSGLPHFQKMKDSLSESDYKEVKIYLDVVDAFSRTAHQCVSVIDLFKSEFLYVSDNPVFLCGNSRKSIIKMGYQFYGQYIHSDDLALLQKSKKAIIDFYYSLPLFDRPNYTLSFDCRLHQPDKQDVLATYRLTILALKREIPWLVLCVVTHSQEKHPGNILIQRNSGERRVAYDHENNKWQVQKKITLSPKEKNILVYCAKGRTTEEMAKELNVSDATIKFHKKNIFKKLQVKNMPQAISLAINYGLIE